jgi:hypothetical protein
MAFNYQHSGMTMTKPSVSTKMFHSQRKQLKKTHSSSKPEPDEGIGLVPNLAEKLPTLGIMINSDSYL